MLFRSEKELIDFANEIMDRKGILFIPSFSVERSQEIACVLRSANFKHKIIMDGMALKVNEIMFRHPEYLRDPKVFSEAIKSATAIREHSERKRAMGEPCVVISPAGMLVGGNAVYYLQQLSFRSEEHTSELHHVVISYAVFCLKKKIKPYMPN